MYYNDATGSYCSDYMEPILDTGYRCDVPYKVDKKKYDKVLEKYHNKSRFKDTTTVAFTMDYNQYDDSDKPWMYSFFAFPINKPDGSDDFYDCALFGDSEVDYKEQYERFIRDVMETVIAPDIEEIKKIQNKLNNEITDRQNWINEFNNIIQKSNNK